MRDFEGVQSCPHCGRRIDKPKYYSLAEVIEITGWSYVTVYRHREEMGGVKRCGRWRFAAGKIELFLNGNHK